MVYATGGLGWADVDYDATVTATGALFGRRTSVTHSGWTAGAGAEWMLSKNISFKAEYLHYNFEDANAFVAFPLGTPDVNRIEVAPDVDTVKVGVNLHF